MKRKILRWIKWILLLYGIAGIAIYYLQDYLMFQPVSLAAGHRYQFSEPYRELNIPFTTTATINVIQFTVPEKNRKGVVLYFHGNKKNIGWYERFAPLFTRNQYEVWMIDYPGFGKSTGTFTESVLNAYAEQLYKLATKSFAEDSILIYGKSMGTGIAARLAANHFCHRLILETPYYSYSSLAAHFFPIYPAERMIHIKLPTYEYLPLVKEPVTIFHGTRDWVIPYSNAARLKPFLKPGDEFITIEKGSHNDLAEFDLFRNKLDSLLNSP